MIRKRKVEVALLLAKFLRDERETWTPRIAVSSVKETKSLYENHGHTF